jgi:hypothetical protein
VAFVNLQLHLHIIISVSQLLVTRGIVSPRMGRMAYVSAMASDHRKLCVLGHGNATIHMVYTHQNERVEHY